MISPALIKNIQAFNIVTSLFLYSVFQMEN